MHLLRFSRVVALTITLTITLTLLSGCASLPPLRERSTSASFTDTGSTALGRAVADGVRANPGKSGVYPLALGRDAFVARALLARAAERSLDVQYYIWHGDTTGLLLFEELWAAAERGVRVRLLLDDNGVAGLDEIRATLDAHPNIEVRLFNPFVNRRLRALGYLTDFDRLNRRMHNKSFTADAQASIVGGRNVGDEYFEAGDATTFADLDVLTFGPAAVQTGGVFDLYWNSDSAYPVALLLPVPAAGAAAALQERFKATRASSEAQAYLQALQSTPILEELRAKKLPIEWAPVKLVYDEPGKALGKAQAGELLLARMGQTLGRPEREIDIVSPYFVPGANGTELLSKYPQGGVRMRILTNSLAASDVAAVHAGYARRRTALLLAGAKLYELKPDAEQSARRKGAPAGSSGASLHAKTFAVDRQRVFVGSFNLDLRSIALNTEMGVVIESPTLAKALAVSLDQRLALFAYEVVLTPQGTLNWIERTPGGEIVHDTEPKTGALKRMGVGVLSVLPIEWLL
jgi:putative cardiolipin synthase